MQNANCVCRYVFCCIYKLNREIKKQMEYKPNVQKRPHSKIFFSQFVLCGYYDCIANRHKGKMILKLNYKQMGGGRSDGCE